MILLRHKITGEYKYTTRDHWFHELPSGLKKEFKVANWDFSNKSPDEYCQELNRSLKTKA